MNTFERILIGVIVAVVSAVVAEHILRGGREPKAEPVPVVIPVPIPGPAPAPDPKPKPRPRPRPFRGDE